MWHLKIINDAKVMKLITMVLVLAHDIELMCSE